MEKAKLGFGWVGAVAFFVAGCAVTFLVLQVWHRVGLPVPLVRQTDERYWGFDAKFKLPTSIEVNNPAKEKVIAFDILKLESFESAIVPVTIRNLTEHPYVVTYKLFAYDAYDRRVDEITDSVKISSKESVLRKLTFDHTAVWGDARTFASFRLIGNIEH